MVQDSTTYYVWIGGSCDYGHKEPTNEARAESQARLGYALQGGGRRKSTDERSKSRDQTCLSFALQEGGRRKSTDARSKSRDQTCLGFALQEEGRRSQPTQPTSITLTGHLQRSLPIQTSSASVSRRKHGTVLLVSKSYHTTKGHCSSKHTTWQQKLWQRQEKNTTMTFNEQALFGMMQDLGYSHGLCITALQILSQDRLAVSEMLAYLYEEQPSEEAFIKEIARICETYHLNNQ